MSDRGGLLKTRAQNFAHHLQSRLQSLSESEASDETWTTEAPSDSEVYYDIDSSLASPEEEVAEPIFIAAQNRDTLPIQRCESSDSQYFDSLDNINSEAITSVSPPKLIPALKKIPILHLKTDRPVIINGHKLLDADVGCSKVNEISSVEVEPNGEKCDNCIVGNNNENLVENGDIQDLTLRKLMIDIRPPKADTVDKASDSYCVFCDIEQKKPSFSDGVVEQTGCNKESASGSENHGDGCCLDFKKEDGNKESDCASDVEENVSLTELLQVLKKEICASEESNNLEDKSTDNTVSEIECPCIEVRESSPEEPEPTAKKKDKDDIEDIETKRKNFRRCSSLKSGKTPPGTPGHKKIVRFADVLGLDLADVKTFMDEVPTIPKSAYEDLHGIDLSSSPAVESPLTFGAVTVVPPLPEKVLMPLFQQPNVQPNFLDRVRQNNVCLESAIVSDASLFAISGLVRVKNIDFHKSVYIRYSIDSWRSFSDLQARYISNSCDGFSDRFSFVLYAHTLSLGQRLEFAVRFHAAGQQFWDSNGGVNYIFECTSRGPSRTYLDPGIPSSPTATWASFY